MPIRYFCTATPKPYGVDLYLKTPFEKNMDTFQAALDWVNQFQNRFSRTIPLHWKVKLQ